MHTPHTHPETLSGKVPGGGVTCDPFIPWLLESEPDWQQPRVREEMLPTPEQYPWTLRLRPRLSQAVMCSVTHSVATLSKGWVSDGFVKADLVHMATERAPAEKRREEAPSPALAFPASGLLACRLMKVLPSLPFFPLTSFK